MDNDADMSAEMSDGRWLDYDQLAQLRRIDKPSAVKLATRNNWRRRKANTGQMQVLVPIHWFERSQGRRDRYADKSVEMSADLSAFDAALQAVTEAKDSEIATLREAFEVMLTAKDGEIVSLREQWERGMAYLDAERSRADELRERLDSAPSSPTPRPSLRPPRIRQRRLTLSPRPRRSPRARRRPMRSSYDRPKPSGGRVASWRGSGQRGGGNEG